jgi:hypothetical protein
MLARELSMLDIDRTRVRLFLHDADLGQVIDQHLGLDLKFSRQFVDSDLICVCHQPLFCESLSPLLGLCYFSGFFCLCFRAAFQRAGLRRACLGRSFLGCRFFAQIGGLG